MNTPLRFLLYVVSLNLVRYLVAGPIEQATVAEPMHRLMPLYPQFFNANFGANDLIIGFVFNFGLWLAVASVFHLAHPVFSGLLIWRSLKIFGLMLLFHISLTAIFMNHHTDTIKPFYLYAILDAIIVYLVTAIGNGFLYRLFFKPKTAWIEDSKSVSPPASAGPPASKAVRTEPTSAAKTPAIRAKPSPDLPPDGKPTTEKKEWPKIDPPKSIPPGEKKN